MKLTQQFAMLNRKAMVDVIMTGMGFTAVETFTTIHNYIDTDAMILRKGSVSAKAGEKLPFKELEFSKATKRITLSHTRLFEEAKKAEYAAEKAEKRAAADATKSTV